MPQVWWLKDTKTNILFYGAVGQKSGHWFVWVDSLLCVSEDKNQGISWSGNLGLSEGKSTSRFIQVIGKIHFYLFWGLKSLSPCWLLAKDYCQLLKVAHISWLMAPSTFKASSDELSPSYSLNSFLFQLPYLLPENVPCKSLCDYLRYNPL